MNKKSLSVLLSKLKTFESPDVKLEQYQTDPDIAAHALWFAFMNKDVKNKVIADLGCGTGIFGLGALALGAKKVFFVDIDSKALSVAKDNFIFMKNTLSKNLNAEFVNCEISSFSKKVDVVIQNPPFGVQKSHTDKRFLMKAVELSSIVYSFHKLESENFIRSFLKDYNFKVSGIMRIKFPLRKTLFFHKKKVYSVDVGFFKIVKLKNQK